MARNQITYFYLDSSPTMPGKYVIKVNHEAFLCKSTVGSYSLLPARMLNISPANYYRLVRDEYGAEIYGKGTYYPIAYFNDNNKAHILIDTLNKLAELIMSERENSEALNWAEQLGE